MQALHKAERKLTIGSSILALQTLADVDFQRRAECADAVS